MRRLGRTGHADGNQADIIAALRAVGATVLVLSGQGYGCPDLLVGFHGEDFLLEVKNGELPRSKRALTEKERAFAASWRGRPVVIVESVEDALRAIGIARGER